MVEAPVRPTVAAVILPLPQGVSCSAGPASAELHPEHWLPLLLANAGPYGDDTGAV